MSYLRLALLCCCLLLSVQSAAIAKDPDPRSNPALASLLVQGVRTYYLGNEGGVDGWFLMKDGQVQMAYTLPNGKDTIVGAMFGADGMNTTAKQVKALTDAHPEIVAEINKRAGQAPMGGTTAAGVMSPLGEPSLSPGEKLIQELSGAKIVALGNASAPSVFMVMDPNCPHCKATWRLLRDFVVTNKLRLMMIPIAEPGSDNERAAAQLLRAPQPLAAWDAHVGGDKNALAGVADQAQIAAVQGNHILTDRWKINMTPYIVYRARDGQIKIVKGEIKQLAAVVADLGL